MLVLFFLNNRNSVLCNAQGNIFLHHSSEQLSKWRRRLVARYVQTDPVVAAVALSNLVHIIVHYTDYNPYCGGLHIQVLTLGN